MNTLERSLAIAWLVWGSLSVASGQDDERFNVIYLCIEDMSTFLGCYGDEMAHTPHIDRFAEESLLFEDVHCQVALCTPSRSSIITGIRPSTSGMVKIDDPLLETLPGAVTLTRHFRDNGYYAARVGKYSDPRCGPLDDAFDRVYQQWGVDDNELPLQGLEEAAAQEKPFFLAIGYTQAHDPWTPTAQARAHYRKEEVSIEGRTATYKKGGKVKELSPEEIREQVCDYYGEVTDVDRLIGEMLAATRRMGLWEKSIILVGTFDHGFNLGYHGKWGKSHVWDHDTQVPMLIRVPGSSSQGRRAPGVAELVDIYPTLVELCGLPLPPQELEGASLVPVLEDPEREWKRAAFSHGAYNLPLVGVKTSRYNLIHGDGKPPRLFDRKADPLNLRDIADQRPDVVAELMALKEAGWRAAAPRR